jgi:hypothetical protein
VAKFESSWWVAELPEDWLAETMDECASFSQKQGVGCLQISAYQNLDRSVAHEDLQEFSWEEMQEQPALHPVRCGSFTGFAIVQAADQEWWRKWWLRNGNLLLFVTYNCREESRGKEDAVVDSILETLKPKSFAHDQI